MKERFYNDPRNKVQGVNQKVNCAPYQQQPYIIVDVQELESSYADKRVGAMCEELDNRYHFVQGSSCKSKHGLNLVRVCDTH